MSENCDHCGGTATVTIEDVKPHGPRAVFVCGDCDMSWINTEPTTTEQIVVALLAAKDLS